MSGDTLERDAAMFWAAVTEPNDHIAGLLVSHLGPAEARKWLSAIGTRSDAISDATVDRLGLSGEMGARRLATAVARWNTRRDTIDIQELRRRTELLGARFIIPCDAEWPQQLADLGPGAPSGLWVRGDATVVAKSGYGAAIVGARAATAYGETVTAMLVSRMAERGLTVVSGGAFGIDACAHQCALRMQTPTIAVLAGGIDQLYPAANSDLLRAIESSGGALVSESAPGSTPMKSRFLSRNRLIAALSGATVVVEAAWRSGSLSTANHALELGRPVGVVPGPITSAQSAGCCGRVRLRFYRHRKTWLTLFRDSLRSRFRRAVVPDRMRNSLIRWNSECLMASSGARLCQLTICVWHQGWLQRRC
jgi:DNA processing protein